MRLMTVIAATKEGTAEAAKAVNYVFRVNYVTRKLRNYVTSAGRT